MIFKGKLSGCYVLSLYITSPFATHSYSVDPDHMFKAMKLGISIFLQNAGRTALH